jgi:hypothetical protein
MGEFRDFETHVLRLLVTQKLGAETVEAIERNAELVSYEYSGVGYFLTVKHPSLPSERIVCDKPNVVGRSGNIESGFVVFIENGELMLECHTWGEIDVPENFREQHVVVETI